MENSSTPTPDTPSEFEGDYPPDSEVDEVDYDQLWRTAAGTLTERAKSARISIEELDDDDALRDHIVLHMPAGRETRSVIVADLGRLNSLLAVPFEDFNFVAGYDAICSYSKGEIEAAVRTLNQVGTGYVFRRLTGRAVSLFEAADEELTTVLRPPDESSSLRLSLGPMSECLAAFLGRSNRPARLSLTLRGLHVDRNATAVEILERVANSFFFTVDVAAGIPLTLFEHVGLCVPGSAEAHSALRIYSFPGSNTTNDRRNFTGTREALSACRCFNF
jgi:hypothetical protein